MAFVLLGEFPTSLSLPVVEKSRKKDCHAGQAESIDGMRFSISLPRTFRDLDSPYRNPEL